MAVPALDRARAIFGVDPQQLLNAPGMQQQVVPGNQEANPEDEELAKFTKVVFRDTEIVWTDLFQRMGRRYELPKLVLFTGSTDSACGLANAAVGPFYCPGDSDVYIDLAFYRDMEHKLNAPANSPDDNVLAHEVGHHVQHLLGFMDMAERAAADFAAAR